MSLREGGWRLNRCPSRLREVREGGRGESISFRGQGGLGNSREEDRSRVSR